MKFMIGDRLYNDAALDQLSLKDILILEMETEKLGRPLKFAQVQGWAEEFNRLADRMADKRATAAVRAEAEKSLTEHEGALWVTAITIWASRKIAGEEITFGAAIDFPMGSLRILPEPEDRKAPADPTRARPGSGRAAKRPAGKRATKSTSRKPSTAG
ncbi:hypothetical protein ACSMXN_09250 [Jatrophihabitans sp. DSM 45814]